MSGACSMKRAGFSQLTSLQSSIQIMKYRLLIAPLFAFIFAFSPAAFAQDPFGAPSGGEDDPFAPGPPPPPAVKFDVEFLDMNARDAFEFIAHIVSEKQKQPLNIVVSKEAADLVLPDMILKQITFDQFVAFINEIGSDRGSPVAFSMSEAGNIWYFRTDKRSAEIIDPFASDGAGYASTNEVQKISTSIFPLEGEVDATLGLIEETIKQTHQNSKIPDPTIKFHEPSQTLIVTASPTDLALIQEVILSINIRQEQKSEVKKSEETNKSIQRLSAENEALKAQLDAIRTEAIATIDRLEAGLEKEKAKNAELEAKLDALQQELTRERQNNASGTGVISQ